MWQGRNNIEALADVILKEKMVVSLKIRKQHLSWIKFYVEWDSNLNCNYWFDLQSFCFVFILMCEKLMCCYLEVVNLNSLVSLYYWFYIEPDKTKAMNN